MNATRGPDSPVCWAPECANVPPPSRGTRPTRYCSSNCRVKAMRRNGGKAPSEPYPPLEPNLDSDVSGTAIPVASKPAPERRTVKAPPRKADPPPESATPAEGAAGHDLAAAPEAPQPPRVTQLHVAVTEDSTVPVQIKVHPLVARYTADLQEMGMATTRQGLQVLAVAERLVSGATSPSAAAGLSKELERLMADLEQNTPAAMAERDPSLIIRERTLAKLKAVRERPAATEVSA